MLPDFLLRPLRGALLRYGRTLDGHQSHAKGAAKAVKIAAWAAGHSAAYRQLLGEQGLTPERVGATPLRDLPVLTKANTFERFPLTQLMRPVPPQRLADVLTSSGRAGRHFGFRLSERAPHESAWFDIDLGLQDIFDIDHRRTLIVNCLPMGVIFRSRACAVANLSVREDMACSILRDVGPLFDQVILFTDPVFIRQILREAEQRGVDWSAIRASVVLGEEVLVESQRDFIASALGIDLDGGGPRLVGASCGMGELGLNLLFETRETIAIRRAMFRRSLGEATSGAASPARAGGRPVGTGGTPSLFCANPLRAHLEILDPDADGYGELCVTMLDRNAVIPLPRYATGDLARLIPKEEAQALAAEVGMTAPWLPMVALRGRIKDQPAGVPSVERVKEAVYLDHAVARRLTGAFRLMPPAAHETQLADVARHADVAGYADVASVAGSRTRIVLQAWDELADDALSTLRTDAEHALRRHLGEAVNVDVARASELRWGPILDYERKFAYLPNRP